MSQRNDVLLPEGKSIPKRSSVLITAEYSFDGAKLAGSYFTIPKQLKPLFEAVSLVEEQALINNDAATAENKIANFHIHFILKNILFKA